MGELYSIHKEKYLRLGFRGKSGIDWFILYLTPKELEDIRGTSPPGCHSSIILHHSIMDAVFQEWPQHESEVAKA